MTDHRARILDLCRSGHLPTDIARRVRMPTARVRDVLADEGVEPENTDYGHEMGRIWSAPADARRAAFAKRAREGARAALAALRGSGGA